MAFAPHFSLNVVVLMLIMAFIGFPLVRSFWLLLFVGGVLVGGGICYGGGLWVGYVGIVFGVVLGLP